MPGVVLAVALPRVLRPERPDGGATRLGGSAWTRWGLRSVRHWAGETRPMPPGRRYVVAVSPSPVAGGPDLVARRRAPRGRLEVPAEHLVHAAAASDGGRMARRSAGAGPSVAALQRLRHVSSTNMVSADVCLVVARDTEAEPSVVRRETLAWSSNPCRWDDTESCSTSQCCRRCEILARI
jgi:hypothetical protein